MAKRPKAEGRGRPAARGGVGGSHVGMGVSKAGAPKAAAAAAPATAAHSTSGLETDSDARGPAGSRGPGNPLAHLRGQVSPILDELDPDLDELVRGEGAAFLSMPRSAPELPLPPW